jgi:hypothetical protein
MMISGIIENNHHLFLSGTMMDQVFQKLAKGFSVELFPLLGQQASIPQMNCPVYPYLLMRRSLPENRIFNLMRNPHHISRSVLLEMTLIQTPKVEVISSHEPKKFFYMPLGLLDWLPRSFPEACAVETPNGERGADIVGRPSLSQIPGLNGGITRRRPTVLECILRWWGAFVNQPPTASAAEGSKQNAVPFLQHLSAPSSLPPGTGETNTGWFEGNVPIDFPLHRCSSLDKARAIHEADGHIGIPEIMRFPVAKPLLRPRDHQISTSPWLPPFWVTMVTQNLVMRN